MKTGTKNAKFVFFVLVSLPNLGLILLVIHKFFFFRAFIFKKWERGFTEREAGSQAMNNKQRLNQQRQNFLLTFFDEDKYCEKEINGFWLVKNWNGDKKIWQVSIYTKESLEKNKKRVFSLFN